jgi:DNA-binding response OmpR family regulator
MGRSKPDGKLGFKILVIEDDPDLQRILKVQLESEGFEVRQAFDGKTGLEAVRSERPHLILLDLMMPGMDGFDVCQRLKSVDKTKDVPVIVLTAKGSMRDKETCFSLQADDYVVKPYEFEELLARIYLHIAQAADRARDREKCSTKARREVLETISEQLLDTHRRFEEQAQALQKELPDDAARKLEHLRDTVREMVGFVEKAREEADPFYDSPLLESARR